MILHSRIPATVLLTSLAACVAIAPLADAQASPYRQTLPSFIDDGDDDEAAVDEEADVDEEVESDVEEADVEGADVEEADVAKAEGPEEAPAPSQPEPKKGLGMMITGGVITGLYALPLTIYGTAIIVASRRVSDTEGGEVGGAVGGALGGVVLGLGVVGLAVGVPLLGVGASRFSKWRKWKENNNVALAPSVGRTAFGTYTPGVTLRF